ncbi:hypothetical protein NECAME_04232 [Necator americanus]|uniref:Uncharacterized protein n=1 Tax=Necator americanus TaxID=51031 RepID=W2SW50_NECAM|nr:hypothetical protein NECAME_04232 [Necator americanus]ETN73840.1 hypothetical protein NECAME_04232 [Necator americanus]
MEDYYQFFLHEKSIHMKTKLPVVRPSARLRTKSFSEWYEVRKATMAEAKLKLRLEQEALKMQDQMVDQKQVENKENALPSPVLIS